MSMRAPPTSRWSAPSITARSLSTTPSPENGTPGDSTRPAPGPGYPTRRDSHPPEDARGRGRGVRRPLGRSRSRAARGPAPRASDRGSHPARGRAAWLRFGNRGRAPGGLAAPRPEGPPPEQAGVVVAGPGHHRGDPAPRRPGAARPDSPRPGAPPADRAWRAGARGHSYALGSRGGSPWWLPRRGPRHEPAGQPAAELRARRRALPRRRHRRRHAHSRARAGIVDVRDGRPGPGGPGRHPGERGLRERERGAGLWTSDRRHAAARGPLAARGGRPRASPLAGDRGRGSAVGLARPRRRPPRPAGRALARGRARGPRAAARLGRSGPAGSPDRPPRKRRPRGRSRLRLALRSNERAPPGPDVFRGRAAARLHASGPPHTRPREAPGRLRARALWAGRG